MHDLNNKCISHKQQFDTCEEASQAAYNRIYNHGDLPDATVQQQCVIVKQLMQFNLGRFLLMNGGFNAYWTRYISGSLLNQGHGSKWNDEGKQQSPLEYWILHQHPVSYAMQDRLCITRKQLQKRLQNNSKFTSLPCGAMDDLLGLDLPPHDQCKVQFIGMDIDSTALELAKQAAKNKGLAQYVKLQQQDAWNLNTHEEFDAIVCLGFTSYESNVKRVEQLYAKFCRALKKGGVLITNFITLSPQQDPDSLWDMEQIRPKNLSLHHVIFKKILAMKWDNRRSMLQTKTLLINAGFSSCRFYPDRYKVSLTAVATK